MNKNIAVVKEVTVTFKKYFIDGVHTCAIDFPTGEVCQFLLARRLGLQDLCWIAGQDVFRKDLGYLIPCDECFLKGA